MTTNVPFAKSQFNNDGLFLTYGPDRKFVARFKHGGKSELNAFQKFLIKNFTQKEYFEALQNEAPLTVLMNKGYVSVNIRKILKRNGYPETLEGLREMQADDKAKRDAARS